MTRTPARLPPDVWRIIWTVEERRPDLIVAGESKLGARHRVGDALIPVGRLNAEQPLHEEVVSLARGILPARTVSAVGHDEQVEILARLNKRVHDLIARRWVDVGVE